MPLTVKHVLKNDLFLPLDDMLYGTRQLVLATGILFGVLQFTLLPFMTRLVGIVRWYRIGWVLTVVSFLLIPNAKTFSWNSSSLFAVGIMSNLLYNCSSSAVRGWSRESSYTPLTICHMQLFDIMSITWRVVGRFSQSFHFGLRLSHHWMFTGEISAGEIISNAMGLVPIMCRIGLQFYSTQTMSWVDINPLLRLSSIPVFHSPSQWYLLIL